jgi:manganese transport protein
VILSFVLPVPLIALVTLTRRPETMGPMANARWLTGLSFAATAAILSLNGMLLWTAAHPR